MAEKTRASREDEAATPTASSGGDAGDRPEGSDAPPRDREEDLKSFLPLKGLFGTRRLIERALAREGPRRDLLAGFHRVPRPEGGMVVHLDLKDLPRLDLALTHGAPRPAAVWVFNAADHERRWTEAKERAAAGGRAFEGEREEWGLVLDALREARLTGRISIHFASRLADALDDTLRGQPPAAWTRRPWRPRASQREKVAIATAQDYVHAAQEGIVNDRSRAATIQREFCISRDTYKNWMSEIKDQSSTFRLNWKWKADMLGKDKTAELLTITLRNVAAQYRERRRNKKAMPKGREKSRS